jgi:hypothetical protein
VRQSAMLDMTFSLSAPFVVQESLVVGISFGPSTLNSQPSTAQGEPGLGMRRLLHGKGAHSMVHFCWIFHPRLARHEATPSPTRPRPSTYKINHRTMLWVTPAMGWSLLCHTRGFAERPELRHAGPTSVNREAELEPPSRAACGDLLGCWPFICSPGRHLLS